MDLGFLIILDDEEFIEFCKLFLWFELGGVVFFLKIFVEEVELWFLVGVLFVIV